MNAIDAIKEEGVQRVQREIVLNMLKRKMDFSLIAELSGLSEEEIGKLANGSV